MVVVRESPRAHLSPNKNPEQWPPRSPFQALLSSPSGRRKWQERGKREGSPSPVKTMDNAQSATQAMSLESEDEEAEDEDEDEDEEILRLKLQAIQAKLKLKKLQKAKKEGVDDGIGARASSRAESLPSSPQRTRPLQSQRPLRAAESSVEVPLSPTKERPPPTQPVSPARRRLGLNAPAKAADVSLKRARDGTQIKRSDSSRSERVAQASKSLSFSGRLNQSRADAQDHQAKQERLCSVRSKGFGSNHTSTFSEILRSDALNGRSTPPSEARSKRPSSAHQMHSPTKLDCEPAIARSASTRTSRPDRSGKPRVDGLFASLSHDNEDPKSGAEQDDSTSGLQSPGYDTFSQVHLNKRHIPHVDVARAMADKEIYTLPRLLKEVKAPHYDPPDCESDFVVFAVLASKSSPFDQKAAHRTSDESKAQDDAFDTRRNKFMVFRLTDLKWEVDCFLFGTAFDQFWKLTPGTLLAILNPGIMTPKGNQNTGQFSLKLGSSEDCVMEIGVARDLGFCTAVKKDGNQCGSWINKTSTEICDFHMELEIDRNRKHRMEVNSMWRGKSDKDKRPNSRQIYGFDKRDEREKKQSGSYHREFGRLYTVPGGGGRSAASLLDAEDMPHGAEQEEQSRKRIADAQRERDLARKLGQMGTGVGAEYMKIKSSTSTTTSARSTTGIPASSSADTRHELFAKPSAVELGLLANKASDQHLSPAKDRKRHFGLGAISAAGVDAVGWGGAKKAGLLLPKDKPRERSPEKGQAKLGLSPQKPSLVRQRSQDGSLNHSPKKKARFMLEKGLREPGRESGGVEILKAEVNYESEEDELDIV